jgi:hypothetical protein
MADDRRLDHTKIMPQQPDPCGSYRSRGVSFVQSHWHASQGAVSVLARPARTLGRSRRADLSPHHNVCIDCSGFGERTYMRDGKAKIAAASRECAHLGGTGRTAWAWRITAVRAEAPTSSVALRVLCAMALVSRGQPAFASDSGCRVVLFPATSWSASHYAACVGLITKLWNSPANGASFPPCTHGGIGTRTAKIKHGDAIRRRLPKGAASQYAVDTKCQTVTAR